MLLSIYANPPRNTFYFLIPNLSIPQVIHPSLPLINLDTVNHPIRILKRTWIGSHIVNTSWPLARVILIATGLTPEIVLTCVVTTKRDVEHDVMVSKVVINDTRATGGGEMWDFPG